MRIYEVTEDIQSQLERFAEWACKQLGISSVPEITYSNDFDTVEKQRSFGHATSDGGIWVYIGDRIPADAMRTLCHELVHYKQFNEALAYDDMDEETRQGVEDVANAMAGRLLREYGKSHVEIYSRD